MEKSICKETNKVRYFDKGEAQKILSNIKNNPRYYNSISNKRVNRRAKKRDEKRIYYCTTCKGFHITSQEIILKKTMTALKKERSQISKELFFDENKAKEWKKDSLPFPIDKIKN